MSSLTPRAPGYRADIDGLRAIAVLFDEGTTFPGFAAALPCLGAAAVIHAGSSGETKVGRFLGLRGLVLVGLASYSLYLWHWPLMVFARHRMLRVPAPRHVLLVAASLAMAVFGVLGFYSVQRHGFPSRLPEKALAVSRVNRPLTVSLMRSFCQGDALLYGKRQEELCRIGAEDKVPVFLLWGDSHASEAAGRVVPGSSLQVCSGTKG